MKMKKYIGGLFGACALTVFAGCYEPLDISENEMDMVAEYAAGVLVEHGTRATDVLLNREEQEVAWAELATPTPRPPIPNNKEDKNPTDDSSKGEGSSGVNTPEAKPTVTPIPENSDAIMQDFTKLIGKEGFEFYYTGHEETVFYQGEGGLFTAAEDGKQLIVLQFDVTNQNEKEANLVLNKGINKEFVYNLRIGKKTLRPSLTLLAEDFCTSYDVTYKAGETKKCVLVFECSKELALNDMVLTVLRDVEGKEDSVLIKVK